jgi:hypothetical protein
LAAKKASPKLSLGTSFLAAQWLDLIWPLLVLTGVERVRVEPRATAVTPFDFEYYPWSHSLLTVLLWGAGFALALKMLKRSTADAAVAGLLVVSHWVLDWITHRPDLPLWPGRAPTVGLGLWNSLAASLVVEVALFVVGVWVYARTTRPIDRRGIWVFWSLIAFLAAVHALNLFGGSPPADTPGWAIAGPGVAMWLLVAWGYWSDRHRAVVNPHPGVVAQSVAAH